MTETHPDELGVKEAAALIGVTVQTIKNYFDQGILKGRRLPVKKRPRRIFKDSALSFLQQQQLN